MVKIVETLMRHKAARVAYWVALVFVMAIFTMGFFMPPMAEISGSVLIAGGSVMIFTLAYIGFTYNASVKIGLDLDDKEISFTTNHERDVHAEMD